LIDLELRIKQSTLKLLDLLASLLALLAGVVLFLLICMIFTDVISRYLLNAPILGVEDTLQMGMVAVIFGAAPYVWRHADHIVVDLLPEYRLAWLRIVRELSIRLLIIGLMVLLAWQAWIGAEEAKFFGNATNMIEIPYQPFYWMITVSTAFHAIVVVIETFWICIGEEIIPSPTDDPFADEA